MFVSSCVNQRDYTAHEVYALCAEVTTAGGCLRVQATGRSMSPSLPDGAVVVLGAVPQPPPIGAIVLGLLHDHVILHRVLWRWRNRVFLAGDANAWCDGWMDSEYLAGMVIEWQPITRKSYATRWPLILAWAMALTRHGGRWLLGRR